MKHILQKFSQGSILAYSLVLLGIVLVASIGMMAASVTNLRSVSSNDKSINAFQIADSGSQAVIKMLKSAGGSDLGDVSGVSCSGGDAFVESPGNFLGGSYKVTFQNSDGETMKCNGAKGKIADVASVKSVGTYADTARAVQVAVAAGGCSGHEGEYITVATGNDASYDATAAQAVYNFSKGHGNILIGISCQVGSGNVRQAIFGSADMRPTVTSSGILPYSFSTDGVPRCGGGRCTSGSTVSDYCDGGWSIGGMCGQ